MPRRLGLGSRVIGGAAQGASDAIGGLLRSTLQEELSNREAMRNDLLQRARIADEQIASGKMDPGDRMAFIMGQAAAPSTAEQLQGIMADTNKAPSMQQVDTPGALATKFRAARIPVTGFGPMAQSAGENGNLPSTQMGDVTSAPFAGALAQRAAKIRSFPAEKIGETMQGEGANLQAQTLYGKWNPDTGHFDQTDAIAAGSTAGQKGTYEGTVAAGSETLQRPGKVQTATETEQALIGPRSKTAGAEAAARKSADLAGDIHRAALTGGLLPEQVTPAMELANAFATQSKDFYLQQDAFRRMVALGKNTSIAGDMGIIFGYMKMLDPASSVREGEQASAQNATNIPGRIMAQYNALIGGTGKLDDKQRQDFLRQSAVIYNASAQEHKNRVKDFTVRANQFRIPPNLVVREPAADLQNMDLIGQTKVVP
jgi:hypothetical protein